MAGATAMPRTARTILIEWANGQDHWVRALVADVVASRRAIPAERTAELYERFLVEKQLRDGTAELVAALDPAGATNDTAEALVLQKLEAVERVNALTSGQTIEFNSALTIVFGKNGSGKSGYVRIFKRVARARASEPVLPNVVASTGPSGPPRAKLHYRLGANEHTLEWNGEEGVHPLTRLDVFDSRATALHLDEDLTYVYTPSDLALFGHVHDAAESIRSRLEADAKAATSSTNPFVHRFARETRVFPKIESLGAGTDIRELEQLTTISEDEEKGLEGLRERVNALRPESSDARLLKADGEQRLFTSAIAVCGVLRAFDHGRYHRTLHDFAVAEEKYRAATQNAFAGDNIPGVLNDAWRAFVAAGDAYRNAIGAERYPSEGDKCLYCQQDLTTQALALLQKYRDYCNSQLKKDVDMALQERIAGTRDLLALDLAPLTAEIRRREQLAQGGLSPVQQSIALLMAATRESQARAREGNIIDVSAYQKLVADLEPALQAQLIDVKKLVQTLRGQADERKKAYADASASLRDIEARLLLRDILPDVRGFVEKARWANKAQTLTGRFRAVLKSLTEAAKQASETLLNQDFERLFRSECQALRAPVVRVDFPGRKGQAARRKLLATDHRLREILSEGEQKVIALADFLAEVQLKASPNPIVVDDPVTSLDYERMGEVVDRIARLTVSRQVIVFTHNIWFTVELLKRFEKRREECSYFDIAEDSGRYGVLSGGTNPRSDSVSAITKRINGTLQEAKKAIGETQAALIENAYDHIRSWCEVVVEAELFQKVVQRYQPNIGMTMLEKIKVQALEPAIAVILPTFEKACRYIPGHSQPLETLNVRPNIAELEKDWVALQAALKVYREAA